MVPVPPKQISQFNLLHSRKHRIYDEIDTQSSLGNYIMNNREKGMHNRMNPGGKPHVILVYPPHMISSMSSMPCNLIITLKGLYWPSILLLLMQTVRPLAFAPSPSPPHLPPPSPDFFEWKSSGWNGMACILVVQQRICIDTKDKVQRSIDHWIRTSNIAQGIGNPSMPIESKDGFRNGQKQRGYKNVLQIANSDWG